MKLADALIKAKRELKEKQRQIELAELLIEKYGEEFGVYLGPSGGITVHDNTELVEEIKKIIHEKKHLKQYVSHVSGPYDKQTTETISRHNEEDVNELLKM